MDKLTELTEAYEKLGKEIEALKAPVKWEPKAYKYVPPTHYLGMASYLDDYFDDTQALMVASGRTYPTPEAAVQAARHFHFHQRVYALAFEMNAKYEKCPRSSFDVTFYAGSWEAIGNGRSESSISRFTSLEAAEEAADIMNRDKWALPIL